MTFLTLFCFGFLVLTSTPALHEAVSANEIKKVNELKDHVDINEKDSNKHTALQIAAMKGHFEPAKALIDAGAKLELTDNKHRTALHLAANMKPFKIGTYENGAVKMQSSWEIINYLIKHHANVNAKDLEDNTPLHLAVTVGDVQYVESLVDAVGIDLHAKNIHRETALDIVNKEKAKYEAAAKSQQAAEALLKAENVTLDTEHNPKETAHSFVENMKDKYEAIWKVITRKINSDKPKKASDSKTE